MSLFVHRYVLIPKRSLSPLAGRRAREGALIRQGDGFADLHPWPELGDLPLDVQLDRLARGETTAQTRATLRFAALDADARARGVSLFEGLTIPDSHWPGDDPPAGFDTVKIKTVTRLPEGVRVRIDFNARLSADEFREVARTLPREQIELVEDPCPYDASTWEALRRETGLRLALDRACGDATKASGGFDVLVYKPAIQEHWPEFPGEIVVTSSMDHPVGQFGAAYMAALHGVTSRCGLMTHVLYEPDAFIERVSRNGARLLPGPGTGIGFDDLLETLPWKRLA